MMKWSSSSSKKFQVKVKPLKLQGFNLNPNGCDQELEKTIVVEMKWRGPRSTGLVPLHRHSSKYRRSGSTTPLVVRQGEDIQWEVDAFENLCSFSISQKDNSFNPWNVTFDLLHGQCTDPTNKLTLIGSVSLNIAELASLMEPQIERKLPVSVRVAGVSSEAVLVISVSFVEIRNSQVSLGVVNDAGVANKEDGLLRMVKDLMYVPKKKKKTKESSPVDDGEVSDDSYSVDSDDPCAASEEFPDVYPVNCVAAETKDDSLVYYGNGSDMENGSKTQVESAPSQKTRLGSVSKIGFLSWKKRRPSLGSFEFKGKDKEKQLIKKSEDDKNTNQISNVESSSQSKLNDEEINVGCWEEKELISRDGQAKLKANVFFASMDQRSEKAEGESACTALVTVIADWLHSNQDAMPSMSEFENLIKEGSCEWRKLCANEVYLRRFPDKHFDLETMLEAELRPLSLKPEKSFVGFFSPEKFESLKGVMSFDAIWDEISVKEAEQKVYIVSWNDHFFVLKVEAEAYYIIDTLGERLFEGCNKAYILKFDDSSCLYRLTPDNAKKEEKKDEGGGGEGGESESLVCSGKECCREFIKRFLAAITLSELEKEKEKGTASIVSLHQRLQIEFHFSSASTSSSSSSFPSLSSSCHHSRSSSSSSSSLIVYEDTCAQ